MYAFYFSLCVHILMLHLFERLNLAFFAMLFLILFFFLQILMPYFLYCKLSHAYEYFFQIMLNQCPVLSGYVLTHVNHSFGI